MSFFNAPITNKVPSGVCSVAGLHAYISSDSHLKELTQRVRADTENDKAFRGKKQTLLPYVTPAGIFSYCREQCMPLSKKPQCGAIDSLLTKCYNPILPS